MLSENEGEPAGVDTALRTPENRPYRGSETLQEIRRAVQGRFDVGQMESTDLGEVILGEYATVWIARYPVSPNQFVVRIEILPLDPLAISLVGTAVVLSKEFIGEFLGKQECTLEYTEAGTLRCGFGPLEAGRYSLLML